MKKKKKQIPSSPISNMMYWAVREGTLEHVMYLNSKIVNEIMDDAVEQMAKHLQEEIDKELLEHLKIFATKK